MNEQWEDAIGAVVNVMLSGIHTCLPGKIESYDHAKKKASVKPLIRKKYADGTVIPLPVIVNVPVVWMQGGGAVFTFPLKKGDGVLLLFAERNIDRWLSEGGDVEPKDSRKFHLSDCIAIPGLDDFKTGENPDNNDDVTLKYLGGKVVIHNDGQVNINDGNLTVDK